MSAEGHHKPHGDDHGGHGEEGFNFGVKFLGELGQFIGAVLIFGGRGEKSHGGHDEHHDENHGEHHTGDHGEHHVDGHGDHGDHAKVFPVDDNIWNKKKDHGKHGANDNHAGEHGAEPAAAEGHH